MEASNSPEYDSFVAIDWSGARSPQRGIQVAECKAGAKSPVLIDPPHTSGATWRRSDVRKWIGARVKGNERLLIGLDFAFAYPYCDVGSYFPANTLSPESHRALWALVDKTCVGEKDFYGGSFYLRNDSPFADYLCYQTYTGARFDNSRLRLTETACKRLGTRPSCTFKCVGSDSVGIGSIAGMRLLQALNSGANERLSIWPFTTVFEWQSAIVEIFPRLYYLRADQDPTAWRDRNSLNSVLSYYKSEALSGDILVSVEDEADALVSAAALRHFATESLAWSPAAMTPCAKQFEGWIFGVY